MILAFMLKPEEKKQQSSYSILDGNQMLFFYKCKYKVSKTANIDCIILYKIYIYMYIGPLLVCVCERSREGKGGTGRASFKFDCGLTLCSFAQISTYCFCADVNFVYSVFLELF